jgi:hypothetical protein
MRLYSVDVNTHDGYNKPFIKWAATQKEAKAMVREFKESYPSATITWRQREIPTTKDGLLRWLNHHVDKP